MYRAFVEERARSFTAKGGIVNLRNSPTLALCANAQIHETAADVEQVSLFQAGIAAHIRKKECCCGLFHLVNRYPIFLYISQKVIGTIKLRQSLVTRLGIHEHKSAITAPDEAVIRSRKLVVKSSRFAKRAKPYYLPYARSGRCSAYRILMVRILKNMFSQFHAFIPPLICLSSAPAEESRGRFHLPDACLVQRQSKQSGFLHDKQLVWVP